VNTAAFFDRWSDRVNPIVIQQVRRGLRSRTFSVSFVLLLVGCVVAALVGYVGYEPESPGRVGQGLFSTFFGLFALVGFVVIPFGAYRSLSTDRDDRTWPLVILTQLSPRQILSGTIGSFLVQAGLYASVTGPFLLFSYLFQGIPLSGVVLVVLYSVPWLVFLTVLATCAATLANSRLARGALTLALLFGLVMSLFSTLSIATTTLLFPHVGFGDDLLSSTLIYLTLLFSYGLVAFSVAAARLTFEADNHALAPRLALLFHLTVLIGTGWLLRQTSAEGALAHDMWMMLQLFAAGLLLSSEPDGLSVRLQEKPPRFTLGGLLLPGASRGFMAFLWAVVAVTLGRIVIHAEGGSSDPSPLALLRDSALVLFYVSFPVLIGRGLFPRALGSPARLRVFALVVLGLSGLLPVLAAALLTSSVDDKGFNFINPFLAPFDSRPHDLLAFVTVALGVGVAIATAAVLRQLDGEARRG
jgi:hypothetical protein